MSRHCLAKTSPEGSARRDDCYGTRNPVSRRRLNVLFITPWYPTKDHRYGGVFVREYARAVQACSNVVVLHVGIADQTIPNWWSTQREIDKDLTAGIPTYRAIYRRSQVRGCTWPRYWAGVIRSATALWKEHGPFDLIHAHVYSTGSTALVIGRWHGIPVVISEHVSAFMRGTLSPAGVRKAGRVFCRADVVLPVSHALQQSIEHHGIKAEFRVVPNTIDTDLFRFTSFSQAPDDTIRILTVTSFVEVKGLAVLFQGLKQASWEGRFWRMDVVGGGPGAASYKQMAENMGLSAYITFHGSMSKSEVARLMRGADFFVLPSLVETFSVATAEALASGVPVLVTRCGGPEEFVDDSCGMVVPPGDALALANGLIGMADRFESYDRPEIARVARERFGYEAVASALNDVYFSVTAGSKQDKQRLDRP
jgi:glycosyltransferase involved in cell wall biosynthesis